MGLKKRRLFVINIKFNNLKVYNKIYVRMNILSPNMDEIADVIIRPSRHLYKLSDLGSKSFTMDGQVITRTDFEVKNKRGLTLKCSFYSKDKEIRSDYVLIYLHCNSGCRIEGLTYLRLAIENDFSYLVFDFSGSGLSDGKYVSLGTIEYMQNCRIPLGLRSINSDKLYKRPHQRGSQVLPMGKVDGCSHRQQRPYSALRFLALNKQSIRVAIFDSPFQSLKKLFIEIGKQRTNLPQILLNVAYKYIKPIIISKGQFDIDQVDLEPLLQFINSPGIFIASKQDSLIPFQHIDDVFNKYNGDKQMFFIEQSHNQARNMNVIKKVFKTLKKYLLLSQQSELKKQKTSYYSILAQKDLSKKKLELTIKSLSQRQLKCRQPLQLNKAQNIHIDFNTLEKRQASCLFPANYKRHKKNSEIILTNHSQTYIQTKRKPLAPKNVNEQNMFAEERGRPKFTGEAKIIEIKMKVRQVKDGRSRQRKTLQHISSKRPPFVELKGGKQIRNSFELRYRT